MEHTSAQGKTSPKDFFLHLLAMIALYGAAVSFGAILFQLINLGIPDLLEAGQYLGDSARTIIRESVSFLLVLFPVYVASTWYLHKSYLADTSKTNLRVRKWLLYFTLFASALVNIFSLVRLVNVFLNGELTLRFFLKVLVIFFIAGSIFGYYIWDLKRFKAEA